MTSSGSDGVGMAVVGDMARFTFRFHPAFRLPALLVGVRPARAFVDVTGDELLARFGPWCLRTPLANVAGAALTGDYAWPKVIGPAHLSLADRGLTFATNPDRGVCISFHDPVPGIDPRGRILHPGLTVTVADTDGLLRALGAAASGDG